MAVPFQMQAADRAGGLLCSIPIRHDNFKNKNWPSSNAAGMPSSLEGGEGSLGRVVGARGGSMDMGRGSSSSSSQAPPMHFNAFNYGFFGGDGGAGSVGPAEQVCVCLCGFLSCRCVKAGCTEKCTRLWGW